jgi:hypothetical protein
MIERLIELFSHHELSQAIIVWVGWKQIGNFIDKAWEWTDPCDGELWEWTDPCDDDFCRGDGRAVWMMV